MNRYVAAIMALLVLIIHYVLIYIVLPTQENNHFLFEAIGNIAFIPFCYFILSIFKKEANLLKALLYVTMGGLVYILFSELFNFQVIIPKVVGALFGALIMWLGLSVYTKLAR
jgi:hypothetical protein